MPEQMDGQQQSGESQDGVLRDPLSVRNTDTGGMKRMAASDGQGAHARKTIKLRPLPAKKPGVNPSDLTSASMPAAPAAPAAEPETAAIPSFHKPAEQAEAPTSTPLDEQATAAIPSFRKAAEGQAQAADAVHALDEAPTVAIASAHLRPSTGGIPSASPAPALKAQPVPLAKPAPVPASAPEEPEPAVQEQATVGMEKIELDEQTQKLSRVALPSAMPAGLPGAKQTIKLRPSTASSGASSSSPEAKPASAQTIKLTPRAATSSAPASAPSAEGAKSKQTIRLVPKKAEVNTGAPVQPKPSDPTINLQGDASSSGVAPSDPTTKFSPTQMVQAAQAEAAQEEPAAEEGAGKPKIGVKKSLTPSAVMPSAAAVQAEMEADELAAAEKPKRDEPSILFTLAAVLALLLMAFLSVMLFVQDWNQWKGGDIKLPIPGLQVK